MLAIDFGTSGLRAAVVEDSVTRRVSFDSKEVLPAAVAFSELGDGGEPLLGATAERMAAVTPDDVSLGIKRLLGQPFDNSHVRALRSRLRHPIGALGSGEVGVRLGGKLRHPVDVAARLIGRVLAEAPGETAAVIGVPSSFGCTHRRALVSAARIAGLSKVRIVSETLAAVLARTDGDGTYLVADLGAGVADVAVVARKGAITDVLGSSADIGWGGDDIDAALTRHFGDEATEGTGVELVAEPEASSRLRDEIRALKEALSTADEHRLYAPMLAERPDGGALDVDRVVRREEVEELLVPLLRRLELPCQEALALAELSPEALDDVILCGGGASLISVASAFEKWLGRPAAACERPDEAVLDGLVAIAQGLTGGGPSVIAMERLPATLGLAEGDIFAPLVAAGARLPVRVHKLVATRADDQDEVVIGLYQGESSNIGHNDLIGLYGVGGLPARPSGETLVHLSVSIDESGLLYLDGAELTSAELLQFKRLGGPGLTRAEAEALSKELVKKPA